MKETSIASFVGKPISPSTVPRSHEMVTNRCDVGVPLVVRKGEFPFNAISYTSNSPSVLPSQTTNIKFPFQINKSSYDFHQPKDDIVYSEVLLSTSKT
jgi:hypothetical protein